MPGSGVRVEPLRRPPIAFAHRGASSLARENTIEAFALAVRLGATGIESDVWLTADGVPVLDHDGSIGRLRRAPIASLPHAALPAHIPTLHELYELIGPDLPVSLDVKDPAAAAPTLAVADDHGALSSLWLCHPDWSVLAGWRRHSGTVHLVDSTRLNKIKEGPERRAMSLCDAGIGVLNLHHTDWSSGLTTLFHRFGLECFAWDLRQPRELDAALVAGVDAIYSDHVDRMVSALARQEAAR